MITLTEENYIKAIYHLGNDGADTVNTNAVADAMQTKASSATDMIKKLADRNYAHYKKYQGVSLTENGKRIAINIIRKHRLWELFLVEKLNFTWDEVHDVAEQLEHIKSQKLIDELDALLGFPTHDPHGDPIPDKDGNFQEIEKVMLCNAEVGMRYVCIGVNDNSAAFLKYLSNHDIALGSVIEVLYKEPFDNSMKIKSNNEEMMITEIVGENLFVRLNK